MRINPLRVLLLAVLLGVAALAQVSSTSSLTCTVVDPTGSVVPGAAATVTNSDNGTAYKAVASEQGVFRVPSLPPGNYSVVVTAAGFRQASVQGIKLEVGVPAALEVKLEVGSQAETITIEAQAAMLQTQTAAVTTTLEAKQIVDLPLVSRDSLDLVLFLPGVNTPGRPRTSTINGLPKGAINITIDGINVQDNLSKSTDGYFTYIRPRVDAVQEVTVSTSSSGSESTGEGAVQVKFVTRSGSNEYRGSLYESHRNPWLNSNYWFGNRDSAPDPRTGKAPRQRVLLNQPGGRVGGPISIPGLFNGKDRAFFFVNYEEFRLPEQAIRTRVVMTPDAQRGIFRYGTAGASVNLLTLAQANGQTATLDPTTSKLLADIAGTFSKGNLAARTDLNTNNFTFTNTGGQIRRFPTVRLDFNPHPKHSIELTWNFQDFAGKVDFLNNTDPAFPGFPNQGSQGSDRFSGGGALRSTLSARMVNEFRVGVMGGTTLFFAEVNSAMFTGPLANQAGYSLGLNNANALNLNNATVSSTPSRRNTPVKQFSDTLSYSKGAHNLSMGMTFSQINSWQRNLTAVPTITFGTDSTDPANAMFVAANFPGAASADFTAAAFQYAVLTGRVTQINANAFLNETSNKYEYIGPSVQRYRYRETGYFFQDNWRVNQDLTLNLGMRWEVQFPFVALNNRFAFTPYEGLFGVSGKDNLFKPGTLTGKATEFTAFPQNQHAYNTDYKNFAPSIGIAWTGKGMIGRILGLGTARGVLRAGYSIAYNRESASIQGLLANNPGGSIVASRTLALGNLVTNTGADRLPVLLRETGRLGAPPFPTDPPYPFTGAISNSANAFDPNLKIPRVQSWSVGLQREVGKSAVLELRYIGNSASRSWQTVNLNEINIVENGFLNEFKLAQSNLQANIAASRGNTFRYFGAGTGTSPLPITLGYFSGVSAANAGDSARYTSALFTNATFVNALALRNPAPNTFASNFYNDAGRRANALAAGLATNLFLVNPDKQGGANLLRNFGGSNYHAATVELRRRFSGGLLLNVNYTFGKAIEQLFISHRRDADKGISPFNIQHAFKLNWIYELPFGQGKAFGSGVNRMLDGFIGGWAIHGTGRVQSGSPFNLGNVQLVGMTRKELQSKIGVRQDDGARITYYAPADIIEQTIRAYQVSATTATGYSTRGAPSGQYIAPANANGCIEVYNGQCGGTRLMLYGPHFTRFDLSAVKKMRVTERVNVELRGEFLNAFNNINFLVGNASNDTTSPTPGGLTWGQITEAYRDTSTTNDPGGRLVQLVLRINF